MEISEQGLALIRRFEGFSAVPYADAAGKMTIGYGHLIRPGEALTRLSPEEAEELLRMDCEKAKNAILTLISNDIAQNRLDALTSFMFNVGAGAFARSTLRRKVSAGLHAEVPAEMARWVWAGGKKLPGLILRRKAEGDLYTADIKE